MRELMNHIKHGLSFVLGAIYIIAWWAAVELNKLPEFEEGIEGPTRSLSAFPITVIVISTVAILAAIIGFFLYHWDDS